MNARGAAARDLQYIAQGGAAQGGHDAQAPGKPGQGALGPVKEALGPEVRLQESQAGLEVPGARGFAVGDGQAEGAP